MITTEKTINKNRYKKLPHNVDFVIIEKEVYKVKDENEMLRFAS